MQKRLCFALFLTSIFHFVICFVIIDVSNWIRPFTARCAVKSLNSLLSGAIRMGPGGFAWTSLRDRRFLGRTTAAHYRFITLDLGELREVESLSWSSSEEISIHFLQIMFFSRENLYPDFRIFPGRISIETSKSFHTFPSWSAMPFILQSCPYSASDLQFDRRH